MSIRRRAWLPVAFVALLLGCGSSSSGGDAGTTDVPGADDVLGACTIRSTWTKATDSVCVTCTTLASGPACSCSGDPTAGMCASLVQTMQNEPDCTAAVAQCVGLCMATDCACINACYSGHAKCRAAASAVDGCVVDACNATCR